MPNRQAGPRIDSRTPIKRAHASVLPFSVVDNSGPHFLPLDSLSHSPYPLEACLSCLQSCPEVANDDRLMWACPPASGSAGLANLDVVVPAQSESPSRRRPDPAIAEAPHTQ